MKKLFVIPLLLISWICSATTYYVSPTGSNSNNGTSGAPWSTLSYACSKANISGDIIHVNAGSYTETSRAALAAGVSIEGDGPTSSIIKVHYTTTDVNDAYLYLSGGTAAQHISGITLDGDNLAGDNAIVVYDRSNVSIYSCTVTNFHIQGVRFDGSSSSNTGNSIHDCTLTNSGGVNSSDRQSTLFMKNQTGLLIYNNTLNQTLRTSANTTGDGIRYEGGNRGIKLYNNVFNGLYPAGEWTFLMECWSSDKQTGIGHGLEIYSNTIVGLIDFGSGLYKGTYAYSVSFHDNVTGDNVTHGASVYKTGFELEELVDGVEIYNNLFKNLDRSIYFCHNGTAGRFSNINIHTNIIRDVPYSYTTATVNGTDYGYGFGIVFAGTGIPEYAQNINIRNNTISAYAASPGGVGVWLDTRGNVSNVDIQNNIIQGFSQAPVGTAGGGGTFNTLVAQKNIFWGNGNSNNLLLSNITVSNLTNDGGIKSNPLFISTTDFHLQSTSPAIDAGVNVGLPFSGNAPDLGAFESGGTSVAVNPVYSGSTVENTAPSVIGMNYNMTLASTLPPAAAFVVMINSVSRVVNTVAVSATKVLLTLASPVVNGDVITVAYTIPATNPLQSSSGGQAATMSAQVVTNYVTAVTNIAGATIKMTVTPNPVHKIINIALDYTGLTPAQIAALSPQIIRIYDNYGKLNVQKSLVTGATSFQIPINLRSGAYYLQMLSAGVVKASQRIIVYR